MISGVSFLSPSLPHSMCKSKVEKERKERGREKSPNKFAAAISRNVAIKM